MELQPGRLARGLAARGAVDRLAGGGEDCHHPVAQHLALHGCAARLLNRRPERLVQLAGPHPERRVAKLLGEGYGAGDVDEQDDGGTLGKSGANLHGLLPFSQELVDGIQHRLRVLKRKPSRLPLKEGEASTGDAGGKIRGGIDADQGESASVKHESRHADLR